MNDLDIVSKVASCERVRNFISILYPSGKINSQMVFLSKMTFEILNLARQRFSLLLGP